MMPIEFQRIRKNAPTPSPSGRLSVLAVQIGRVLDRCRTAWSSVPGPVADGRADRAAAAGLARLTVYAIKVCRHYGGGMAVVAASSPEEASRLAAPLDALKGPRYRDPDYVYVLPVPCFGEQRVLSQCKDVDPTP